MWKHSNPELIPHLSSTKTPAQILGVLAKTYGAKQIGADPKNMCTVAIMPCVSKKFEGLRAEYNVSGYRDVDYTLDTRELATDDPRCKNRFCQSAG